MECARNCGGSNFMGILEKVINAEQSVRKQIERVLGGDPEKVPQEVRREILDQVESRILVDADGKVFPYEKTIIRLHPTSESLHDAFAKAFLQDGSLKEAVMERLKESQAKYPETLEMVVNIRDEYVPGESDSSPRPLFRLEFLRSASPQKKEVPETVLTISRGQADQLIYRLKKDRILIGRLAEVTDREGRLVRKNDLVFLDLEDDINSTVGRTHARIWFNFEKQEFRLMDELSRYGTRILRDGRFLEIPGGNARGVRLKTGDEIFCGQACIRFELTAIADGEQKRASGTPDPDASGSSSPI
jgi:hypothetical protein